MAKIHILKKYLVEFKVVRHSTLAVSTSRMSKDISRMILEVDYCFHQIQIQGPKKGNTNSRQHQDNRLAHEQAADQQRRQADEQQ
jgi:hypothetical protein